MVTFTITPFPIYLAEAAKVTEVDYEDEMNGLESNDDESDGEMGMDDTEDGDEAESMKLQKLAAQVCQVLTDLPLPKMFFVLLKLSLCQFPCSLGKVLQIC